MAPLYQIYAKDLGWTVDKAMLDSMKEDNAKTLAELDVSIKDAEENLGKRLFDFISCIPIKMKVSLI